MDNIIVKHDVPVQENDVLNPNLSIDARLCLAGKVAGKFKTAIKQLGLIENIKGNEYVTVSGWSTLGTLLGIHVENIQVKELPVKRGYGFHAKVDLVDRNGYKIGEGDGIATNHGHQKEIHTVYSMAQTRAVGKAYRLCLAWLVEMAGYQPTPAEEMPDKMRNNFSKSEVVKKDDYDPVSLKYAKIIKSSLQETGTPVNKVSMKNRLFILINNGDISEDMEDQLLKFISEHCPDALESGEELE